MEKQRKKCRYFSGPNKLLPADYVFMVVLGLLMLTIIFPFLNVIAISFSSDVAVIDNPAMIFPKDFQAKAYWAFLSRGGIWRTFALTILYVAGFVFLRIITSVFGGYAISRKVAGKRFMTIFLLIPTLFSGGMMPTYLLISSLGFVDNILVFFIPGCVSCSHILLVKAYIRGLPSSVEDAAMIDGANLMQVLRHVIMPMSLPVLLTIGIITAIAKWNDWWNGFMYIQDKLYLYPLQNVVQKLTIEPDMSLRGMGFDISNFSTSFQMVTIVVSTLPIVCTYPFFQKYFEQGLNMGSVKD